jgi:hypothetical protein
MSTPSPAADRVFAVMLEMKKIDLAVLEAAHAGTPLEEIATKKKSPAVAKASREGKKKK